MNESDVNVLLKAAPYIGVVVAWVWRVERALWRMKNMPYQVNRLDRRSLLILMKVDPEAAKAEVSRDQGQLRVEGLE